MTINNIFTHQNKDVNIKYLKAQRILYSRAKSYQLMKNVGELIILVSGGSLAVIYPLTAGYIATASIVWLILSYYGENYISSIITKAATIQEMFDVGLFDIGWNKVLVGTKVLSEDVIEEANKFIGKDDCLKNWYSVTKTKSHWSNVKNCQRTNLYWDQSLRTHFRNFAIITFMAFFALVLFCIYTYNPESQLVIIGILAPALPFLISTIKSFNENNLVMREKQDLRSLLDDKKVPNREFCRNIQDKIFNLRNTKATIPDWYYWLNRASFENIVRMFAKSIKK